MILAATALALAAAPAAQTPPAATVPTPSVPVARPSKEAADLGVRLARANTLAAVAPVIAEKEIGDVVKEHPDWSAEDAATYRTVARRVAAAGIARINDAIGNAYARRLSIADLTQLVTALESPAAARRRAIEPQAFFEAMKSVGAIDFKGDTLAAFCLEMGKGCPKK